MKISPQIIADLVQAEQGNCVSIYLPSPDSRLKKGYGERFPEFTHQVKIARELLARSGMKKAKISSFLKPILDYQSDERLFSRKHKGMVFFCQENFNSFFHLPFEVEPCTFVGPHFYILPILSLLDQSDPESYVLLRLTMDKASLYKGTGEQFARIDTDGIIPFSFREVVGEDFKESPLQKRSIPTGRRQAIYHGMGTGKDDRKPEIEKFFREIDKGMRRYFSGNRTPVVVDALPHLFSIYASVSHLPNLIAAPLSPPLNGIAHKNIPERVIQHIKAYYGGLEKENSRTPLEELPAHLKSENLEEIQRAAIEGRIKKLIMLPTKRTGEEAFKESLNLIAIHTLRNGGGVIEETENDPFPSSSPVWAVFHY